MVVLLLCSIWSVYVCIERLMYFRKAKQQSLVFAKQVTQYLAQDRVSDAIEASRKYKNSHLARVTRAGLIEFQLVDSKPGALSGADVVEAARRAIERETLITYSDFKKGTGSLATIATTAPFIGLLGTVIGIIAAFHGMATSGSGGIGAVSQGISEALVATALGLMVAIPAAWMYNYFTNVLERFQVEMSNSSSELIDFFIKKHGGSDAVGVRQ
ncbi:MAG: MotA/TolQ/ExbB proton channel family protein [Acidobacteriota bacterium]